MCVCVYKNVCCWSKESIKIYFKIRRSTNLFCSYIVLYMCMFPACCFRQKTYVAQGLLNGLLNETCLQFECFFRLVVCFI